MKPVLLFCLFALVSCVNPKSEMNIAFLMQPEEFKILKAHCEEINSNGDILQLLKEIKRDTEEALMVMENPGKEARVRLSELAESVSLKSDKIKSLSKAEWTSERWSHEILWQINEEDFKRPLGTRIQILSSSLDSIYLMGQRNAHLEQKIELRQEGNEVEIKYKGLGSSLELCQLQKTLLVVLDVYAKSLGKRKHHFFSLFVR